MNLATTTLQSADNILGRRLQQSDDVGNKLVLALEVAQCLEILLTDKHSLFDVCGLECGDSLLLLPEVLNQSCRSIAGVSQQQRGASCQ